jgi:hypothetical protein
MRLPSKSSRRYLVAGMGLHHHMSRMVSRFIGDLVSYLNFL